MHRTLVGAKKYLEVFSSNKLSKNKLKICYI